MLGVTETWHGFARRRDSRSTDMLDLKTSSPIDSRYRVSLLERSVNIMKTILLVDDELDIRMILRIMLEEPTTHILEAGNGRDALELARESPPDLILLDWVMPGLNGLEVVEALRSDPDTADIPVIMLSSRDMNDDLQRLLALNVLACLAKPFSPLELLQTVENAL